MFTGEWMKTKKILPDEVFRRGRKKNFHETLDSKPAKAIHPVISKKGIHFRDSCEIGRKSRILNLWRPHLPHA
jgi:hypothetical protein